MEEVEKLYSVLTEGGYYTKSFEEFQEQFKDPSYQERVFCLYQLCFHLKTFDVCLLLIRNFLYYLNQMIYLDHQLKA